MTTTLFVIAGIALLQGAGQPETFLQGVFVGVVLGVLLSEVVLPRIVDMWTYVLRHRRGR